MIRSGTFWERIGDWCLTTFTDPAKLRLYNGIKSFIAIMLSVLVLVALGMALKLSLGCDRCLK
ncbi:hypothetical protein [Dictyobacter arantiisoli]|uniref:Uncharacterized protein n=1 Tax=Dictyobacter arantiisoli TaxID=2014874 RepID=A0A5A5TF59_9CHLR|nr:hypothetical protein [Dictyobacter arantiisoli]GCF09544.1 hypothetical protein KDI_31080 [Dictyobacter arantiisoli]